MDDKPDLEQRSLLRERRLNMRLMAFWWDQRGNRRYPAMQEFDPDSLTDVWTHCFTLAPNEPPEDSVFRYIGETIGDASGVGDGEATVGGLTKDSLLDHATRNIHEVLNQKVPVVSSGEFDDRRGNSVVFRSILLPFSSDQETVDAIVGGARCKIMRAA